MMSSLHVSTRRLEELVREYAGYLDVPVAQDYARDIIDALNELLHLRAACASAYPVVRYALLYHSFPCVQREAALKVIEPLAPPRLCVQPNKEATP